MALTDSELIKRHLKDIATLLDKPSKLRIKNINEKLVLCNEAGEPLPMQGKLKLTSSGDNFTIVKVEFAVDGDNVKIDI